MASYNVTCRVAAEIAFNVEADSLDDALVVAREKAANLGNPFRKGLDWMSGGKPEVIGVCDNA